MEDEILFLLAQTADIQELLMQLNDAWNDEYGKRLMQSGFEAADELQKELKELRSICEQ